MHGMHATTGTPLSGTAHLVQSVADILSTPLGSRVMRRDYGSHLPALIDQPANAATAVRLYAAVALALMRWEPRLAVASIAFHPGQESGQYTLELGLSHARPLSARRLHIPLDLSPSPTGA